VRLYSLLSVVENVVFLDVLTEHKGGDS